MHGENPLRQPQDLQSHTLVPDDTGTRYDGIAFWDVWLNAAGVEGVDTIAVRISVSRLALEAASDSLGVVATFPVLASAELAVGRLILPFQLHVPLASATTSYAGTSRKASAVEGFRDWAAWRSRAASRLLREQWP
jgi:LysR family glycine cleavage system transcriptional activator